MWEQGGEGKVTWPYPRDQDECQSSEKSSSLLLRGVCNVREDEGQTGGHQFCVRGSSCNAMGKMTGTQKRTEVSCGVKRPHRWMCVTPHSLCLDNKVRSYSIK